MIVRDRPGFLGLFLIFRGTVLERIWPQVLAVMLLSALVVWGHARLPGLVPSLTGAPFALLGIALSIFLSFRNGAGYDRWWEARKAWGSLVAAARDLDRQTLILTRRGPAAAAARVRLCHLAIVFSDELVRHLRDGLPESTRPPLLDPSDRAAIAEEIKYAKQLCARHNWPVIDVTRKSIEETAAAIVALRVKHR